MTENAPSKGKTMASQEAEIKLVATDKAVLKALSEGPNYGLGIMQRSAALRGSPILNSSNVYHVIRGLKEKGLLESRESDSLTERGNQPRTYYSLTPVGKAIYDKNKL